VAEAKEVRSVFADGFWTVPGRQASIAPLWHLCVLVLVTLVLAAGGAFFQSQSAPSAEAIRQQNALVPLYLSLIGFEWLLFLYVWFGLRLGRRKVMELVGGRWTDWKDVARDVAIGLVFWILWREAGALVKLALGQNSAKSIASLLPEGPIELLLWLALSISAGICEEVVYRGYLQQQFSRLTRSPAAGLLAQAILFGISHGYQGWKPVVTITGYGALYGLLAHWRRNLRSCMIAHAWSDAIGILPWG
jgi:membrane protease YdiL (CAAX protease family)